jgi:HEAT repeat protein
MRHVIAIPTLLVSFVFAHADETTDRLAKELVGVVRDPRQGLTQRVEAARTLAKLGPQAGGVVPDLIAQLKRLQDDELEPLQEAVVETLGAIGSASKAALPTLATVKGRTTDIDQAIKQTTRQILSAEDSQDLKTLIEQTSSRDVGLRLRAVKTLGSQKADAAVAVPALTVALSDPDGDVRRAAVAALRAVQPQVKPSKELVQAVVADLADPDDNVRLTAVRTLGKMGSAANAALPALQPLLNDPDKDIRRAAGEALIKLGGP